MRLACSCFLLLRGGVEAEMNDKFNNLKDKAYTIIKNKIISCELMPGTPISESQLMAEIGVSRTPIREALSKLENENLVKIYPKRGIFITHITVKDIIDIYAVREVVEPLAARLATPNIDAAALQEYYHIYSNPDPPSHPSGIEEHIRIDREFHTLIANSTGNQHLAQILLGMYDQNSRIRILSKMKVGERLEEAGKEHLELILSFIERNPDRASEVMHRHIVNGRKAALKIVTG